jgi:hypothetical protein
LEFQAPENSIKVLFKAPETAKKFEIFFMPKTLSTRSLRRGTWWTTSTPRASTTTRRLWRSKCTRSLRRRTVPAVPAVHTSIDSPLLKLRLSPGMLSFQFQSVTPLSNPGPEKPEKRDVMININPEDRYSDKKTVEKQLYEQPEKRDEMVNINPEGEHDEEKMIMKKNNMKQVQTEHAVTDPREHFIKGDGLEDAPEEMMRFSPPPSHFLQKISPPSFLKLLISFQNLPFHFDFLCV